MHEVGVIQSVLEIVEQRAKSKGFPAVERIYLRIGSLSSVVPLSLHSAFDSIKPGTFFQDTKLDIEWVEAVAFCTTCDRDFNFRENGYICPQCGEPTFILKQGRELEIKTIEWSEETCAKIADATMPNQ